MVSQLSSILFSLFLLAQFEQNTLSGTIVSVQDGDTLTMKSDGRLFKLRLANVYAPQLRQPMGQESKEFVESLVLNRRVGVDIDQMDSANSLVVEVKLEDGRWLNDELVAAGLAWHYRVAYPQKEHLAKLEHLAWSNKLGLWLQKNPVPPWEFTRERKIPPPPSNPSQVDYDRIFHYGIIGDKKTRRYKWPTCYNYRIVDPDRAIVFSNTLDAEAFGMRLSRDCR